MDRRVLNVKAVITRRALWSVLSLTGLIATFTTSSSLAAIEEGKLRRAGLEVEFANPDNINPRLNEIPDEMFTRLLEIVRKKYSDRTGTVGMQVTQKNGRDIKYGEYKDKDDRKWMIVPESVNTTGYDGLEFVTPPLDSEHDERTLKRILVELWRSNRVATGVRSAVHVTVDVSDKIEKTESTPKGEENISRIVDTILYIEQHWAEIYAGVSPQRYGTIVNRFGVPLAFDQPDLLRELAQLSPELRTYSRVQAIFRKYHQRELALNGGDAVKAWKYRGGNYGKLFGLTPDGKVIPAIEFRVPDVGDPDQILADRELFRAIIEHADKTGPIRTFRSPFAGLNTNERELRVLNERLSLVTPEAYEKFLSEMQLEAPDFPMWRARAQDVKDIAEKVTAGKWQERLLNSYDFRKPFEIAGGIATLGLEAEFRGANSVQILGPENKVVNAEKFPFIDPKFSKESTGNFEIRSVPTDSLAELERQLKSVRSTLKSDLKGFHVHMRVPLKVYQDIGEERFNSWLSRMSDSVSTWRLENRMHFFALKTWSTGRLAPFGVKERGTMRLSVIGDQLDIEIRGGMNAAEFIVEIARIVLVAMKNPEYIAGYEAFQASTHLNAVTLESFMREYVTNYEKRDLTPDEVKALNDLQENAVDRKQMIWPILGFEKAPYFNAYQQKRLTDARFEFAKSVRVVLKNQLELKKYADDKEFYKQFRFRIKKWSKGLEFNDMMMESMLMLPSPRQPDIAVTREMMREAVGSRAAMSMSMFKDTIRDTSLFPTTELLKELASDQMQNYERYELMSRYRNELLRRGPTLPAMELQKALYSENRELKSLAMNILATGKHPATQEILVKALKSKRPEISRRAAEVISDSKEASFRTIKLAVKHADEKVRVTGTQSLGLIAGWEKGRELLDRSLKDKEASVRREAYKMVPKFRQQDVFSDPLKALHDPSTDVSLSQARSIGDIAAIDVAPLVLEVIRDHDNIKEATVATVFESYNSLLPKRMLRYPESRPQLEASAIGVFESARATLVEAQWKTLLPSLVHVAPTESMRLIESIVETNPNVHSALLTTIGNVTKDYPLGDELGAKVIESIMKKSEVEDVRREALRGLIRRAEVSRYAGDVVVRVYKSLDWKERVSLAKKTDFRNVGPTHLAKLFKEEPSPEARAAMVENVSMWNPKYMDELEFRRSVGDLIGTALNDADPKIREAAVRKMRSHSRHATFITVSESLMVSPSARGSEALAKILVSVPGVIAGNLDKESVEYSELLFDRILRETPIEMAPRYSAILAKMPVDQLRELGDKFLHPSKPRLTRLTMAAALRSRTAAEFPELVKRGFNDPDPKVRELIAKMTGAREMMNAKPEGAIPRSKEALSCSAFFAKAAP